MPVRFHKAATDRNVWGLTMNDALNPALLLNNIIIALNGNNPPTVKAGSKFYIWDEETYLIPDSDPTGNNVYPPDTSVDYLLAQAVFEQADRTFSWNSGLFPAIGNSKTYYLYCSGGEDTDETSIGKGIYGATETAPTYSELKCGWYLASGERVIARFQTTGAGVVYGLHIYKSQKKDNVFNIDSSDHTIADNDGCDTINVTTGNSDRTITLPTLADNIERRITINKVDSGTGNVIIDGEGAETINTDTTTAIKPQFGTITLLGTSACWLIEYEKRQFIYLGGSTYNAVALNVTSANGTLVRGTFEPYQKLDGSWALKGRIAMTFSPTVNNPTIAIAGVVFKNTTNYQPGASVFHTTASFYPCEAAPTPNTGNIITYLTAGISQVGLCFDYELESKPTWLV